MKKLILSLALVLAYTGVQAAPVLIDFDEVTPQTVIGGSISVDSKGYNFFATTFMAGGPPEAGVSAAGITAMGDCFAWGAGCGAQVTMTSIDSNPFAILLIGDFTGFYSGAGDFSGTLFGGGAADLSVPIGTGDWLSLETFRLSSFCPTTPCGYYDVQLDDVTVRAVPIPAAFWLFASALGALGWRRRNRY